MENFDFLNLPLVVQDIITEEVVHKFSSEDWLQLALTSKYCSYLVQRAHPKKIIYHLKFSFPQYYGFLVEINFKKLIKTADQMVEILSNCQVETLEFHFAHCFSSFVDALAKSSKFATKLIFDQPFGQIPLTFFQLYDQLDHLNTIIFKKKPYILFHYPPNIIIEPANSEVATDQSYLDFFRSLARSSKKRPLSSLIIKKYFPAAVLQQFFSEAKFLKDAEIFARFYMRNGNKRQVYLTFIEGDNFGFEIYSRDASVVTVDERITSENERILTFSRMKFPCEPFKEIPLDVDIPFNVTTASSRKRPIYSGILTKNEREFKIKNVKPNDWIKVTFASGNIEHQIRYSKKFLNTYFPRSKHVFAFQHLEKINSILDMQIGITPLDLAEINFVFESRGIIANVPTHFTRSRSTKRKIYN